MSSPVLIVGSGPSGLVAALTLLRNGVPVRVIEKNDKFHDGQRGAGIQPRSQEMYRFLGVDQVLSLAQPLMASCMYELPGGRTPKFTFEMQPPAPVTPSTPYPNARVLGQHHAEEILRAYIAEYGARVELSTELVDFEQDPSGVIVHIVRRSSSGDTKETFRTPFLIGADGAKSVTRKGLGLEFSGVSREEGTLLFGDLYLTGLGTEHWHVWGDLGTKGVIIRPTEYPGRFQFMGAAHGDVKPLLESRDAFVKYIEDATDRNDLGIGEIIGVTEYRPNIRMVNKFGEGRVFVVGDAAHVHSPTGGQGMNSSVQDSFNLGWKLALVHKGLAPLSLLDTYSEERVPVIQQMLERTTELLNKTIAAKKEDEKAISAAWARPRALLQLGVNYRWSSIVLDERRPYSAGDKSSALDPYGDDGTSDLHAGDRAPESPGLVNIKDRDPTSLFSLFKATQHTILLFTSDINDATPISRIISSWPGHLANLVVIVPRSVEISEHSGSETIVVIQDQEGHAYGVYHSVIKDGFRIIVVRPDGAIGAVLRATEGVQKYRDAVFSHKSV